MTEPLKGLLVADFSRVLAGPLATMMLADLGADVVKVEQPPHGDVTRSWGPPFTKDGESAYYLSINRNKRSVALDLTVGASLDVARKIALSADVLIENFRAGTMERFGLGYESLSRDNPGLVFCRISAFGSGDGRDLPGYDFLVQALSGLMSISGDPAGPPMKTGVAIVDVLTGLHASIGVLAALAERGDSGKGQFLEVNLMSSALASLVNQASSFLTTGTIPSRMSNQHPNIAPYETFATATGPIVIAVGSNDQFRELCGALGNPSIATDARWATNEGRVGERSSLVEALEAILRGRAGEEWLEILNARGIPSGPVNDMAAAFDLANRLGLEAVQRLPRRHGDAIDTVSNPITFGRTPVSYRSAPPELGADTDTVLEWLDGRSRD